MMRKKSFRTELPVNASYPSGSRLSVSEERVQGECANPFSRRSVFISVFFFNMFRYRGDTRQKPDTVPVGFSAAGFFFMLAAPDFWGDGKQEKNFVLPPYCSIRKIGRQIFCISACQMDGLRLSAEREHGSRRIRILCPQVIFCGVPYKNMPETMRRIRMMC